MNGFEKRTAAKKQQVLTAAFTLMNTTAGIEGLTIDEVAQQAKVGKTTIFKYFGSKEQLIHHVFRHFLDTMMQGAKEIMAEELPFEATLVAMSQNKIHYLEQVDQQFFNDLMAYYTREAPAGSSLMLKQYTTESFNMMLEVFHRGRKEGKVDLKYSDEFLLLFFQALVEGIASPHIYEKILPYTMDWAEVITKGLAPNQHP